MFKVFVYSKRTSKKVATITGVVSLSYNMDDSLIEIYTGVGEMFTFDTTVYKTTIYQN